MHRMIIFDDGRGRFGPMTDLRASFELRTGMLTTAGRLSAHWPKSLAAYWVPEPIRPVVAARANAPVNELPSTDEEYLCLNGRLILPASAPSLKPGHAAVERESGDVVAALLGHMDAQHLLRTGSLHERVSVHSIDTRVLYRDPWDIVGNAWQTVPYDILNTRVLDAQVPDSSVTTIGEHPIEIHERARIFPHVVLDATHGPIMIHERAVIRPGAILCGPCSVGRESTVIDRAHIKPNTAIGPCCKVGGEVGCTIFQGYANKAHDGHLGDSWVGKWVNFGAGTTNSNLLNTYGEVVMRTEPDGPRQRTGLTFLGAIVGDHAKTAICTRLMTGTVIGTGAMIATTAPPPTTVKRFAWLTDDGNRAYRLDKFVDVVETVMARRRKKPTEAYLARIGELHALHAGAGKAANRTTETEAGGPL
jgi:UDP-N-acetylglucosamine diphosphorylase / glucose-1-phosphate thymidylyltransferase / UDP-N-acetylgalactosamine diphosphorylase / glucosamine-1-phosphate N-acetyltransferase / galactosamine-1-phosphate N-acetyltransferase